MLNKENLVRAIEAARLGGRVRACYYEVDGVTVYMRVGTDTLTIANVSVPEERQRQGIFAAFLGWCESQVTQVIVESVLNAHLEQFLQRRGYSTDDGCYPPTMRRIKTHD